MATVIKLIIGSLFFLLLTKMKNLPFLKINFSTSFYFLASKCWFCGVLMLFCHINFKLSELIWLNFWHNQLALKQYSKSAIIPPESSLAGLLWRSCQCQKLNQRVWNCEIICVLKTHSHLSIGKLTNVWVSTIHPDSGQLCCAFILQLASLILHRHNSVT